MNILFKKWNSGKIVLIILFVILLTVALKGIVLAQGGEEYGWVTDESLKSIKSTGTEQAGLLTLIGYITAGILVVLGYFVDFALQLGNQVISLPLVQVGSQVVLGFANLGFVLAIIVMAFATIFRVQSYAMKQTLWKLIVAALLVNFSLVIAGGFISVSNSFTNYFLSQSTGTNLATGLAGVLNPQDFLDTTGGSNSSFMGMLWGGLNALFKFIASLFFVIVFSFIIILTFFTLVIMLFIRAIYLGILLVLMPIVWLAWIFPATSKHWKKWWTEFIRWNFFAPAVLFFIFLIIKTGNEMANMTKTLNVNTGDPQIQQAFSNMTVNTNFFQYAAQSVIGCGLLLGGLFAANSLGITFASTAYGWAQGAGKGFGKWVGRESLEQTGGRIFGSKLFKGDAEKGKRGLTERLSASRIPGVRFMGRGLNRLGLKTEETLQAGYAKLAKRMTPDEKNYEALNSRGTRRAAILQQTAKDRDIDMKKLSPLLYNPTEMKAIERNFSIAGLDFKDFTKATGLTPETVQASADIEKAKRENNPEALIKAEKNLKEATDRLVKSIPLKDYSKGQWNDIFEHSDNKIAQSIQKALSAGFAEHENGAYSKVTPQIKGKNMDNYIKIMNGGITEIGINPELATKALKADEKFRRTLSRRAEFGEEAWTPWTPGAGTTTT